MCLGDDETSRYDPLQNCHDGPSQYGFLWQIPHVHLSEGLPFQNAQSCAVASYAHIHTSFVGRCICILHKLVMSSVFRLSQKQLTSSVLPFIMVLPCQQNRSCHIYITAPALLFFLPSTSQLSQAAGAYWFPQLIPSATIKLGGMHLGVEALRWKNDTIAVIHNSSGALVFLPSTSQLSQAAGAYWLLHLIPTYPITSIGLLDCAAHTKHFWAHLLVVGQSISAKSLEKGLQQ